MTSCQLTCPKHMQATGYLNPLMHLPYPLASRNSASASTQEGCVVLKANPGSNMEGYQMFPTAWLFSHHISSLSCVLALLIQYSKLRSYFVHCPNVTFESPRRPETKWEDKGRRKTLISTQHMHTHMQKMENFSITIVFRGEVICKFSSGI